MTTFLVTGAGGQLGYDVTRLLNGRPDTRVVAATRAQCDITDAESIAEAFQASRPDCVINCAAYTAVDAAETDEAAAALANATAPGLLAAAASSNGARLVHVSTDYVFGGDASTPYPENAAIEPKSAYGRTKAAGERAVLSTAGEMYVARTAWVYGQGGKNFAKTMARLLKTRDSVEVVGDQHGTPTWTGDLAAALIALAAAPTDVCAPGIWHLTNSGNTTWFGFAREIAAAVGVDPERVHRTTSDKFPSPTKRPAWSVLSTAKWDDAAVQLGLRPMRDWRDGFRAAVAAGLDL